MPKLIAFFTFISLLSCATQDNSSTPSASEDRPGKNTTFKSFSKAEKLELKLDVKKKVFNNGLTVLVIENHHLPIFSYKTFYGVGSKYEYPGFTGASHFLEHMMFKGGKKFGPGVFDSSIEANGGRSNAYTNRDLTVYYENMPSHSLKRIIELEADRMNNLLLEPKAFETERNVILEERKGRYENSARGQLFKVMMTDVFVGTPYEESVIGSIPDLKTVSREQMLKYFKTFYAPNAAVITVVGDVDADEVFNMIEKNYGEFKPSAAYEEILKTRNQKYLYHHRAKYGRHIKIKGQSPLPMFAIAFKGEPLGAKRAYAMDILSSVLGSGNSSYLHKLYVSAKRPMLGDIYVANYNLQNNGVFLLGGSLLRGISINSFRKSIRRRFKKICDEGITPRSIEKTKNQYIISYYRDLETNSGLASFIGTRQAYLNNYKVYQEELENYQSITMEEVVSVCKEIFYKDKYNLYTVWSKHPKMKIKGQN